MIPDLLTQRLRTAVLKVLPDADVTPVRVRPASDPKHGDYQSDAVMVLAKAAKTNPRQLAANIVGGLDVASWCQPVEIAGPGFLNFRIRPEAVRDCLQSAVEGRHLFVSPPARVRTVVIDFSSPNVAKPMHVGHIRSTALGDSLSRILRRLGHQVVTDNHIGDWGTQFGMLLLGWKTLRDPKAIETDAISELERIYKALNAACEKDPAVKESARAELVRLQEGDPVNMGIWKEMIRLSQVQFDTIYGRLGVTFDHTLGESFYNPRLKSLVAEVVASGVASESEGAFVVFSDGKTPPREDPFLIQRDGEWHPNPALVQKSDGAANYATTDLATLEYRLKTWNPDEIIYVTDGRQQLHFRQVFAAFARWQPKALSRVKLTHAWFGSILGEDGRPFKTRSGDTVKLAELLDEAEVRALAVVREKRPDLAPAEQSVIARQIGLGAVKYQDLLPNRQSDYVFQWDKMLALTGNTSPYIQYQFTRAGKVARDGGIASGLIGIASTPEEIALSMHLLNYGSVLQSAADECRPNYLCNYLFELAQMFSRFYENCPVLKAPEPDRTSRLHLCTLTARVLKDGLGLLGIEAPDLM